MMCILKEGAKIIVLLVCFFTFSIRYDAYGIVAATQYNYENRLCKKTFNHQNVRQRTLTVIETGSGCVLNGIYLESVLFDFCKKKKTASALGYKQKTVQCMQKIAFKNARTCEFQDLFTLH